MNTSSYLLTLVAALGCPGAETSASKTVHNGRELRDAVARAAPGARILIAPGEYPGGFYFSNLHGEKGRPIVLAALDPENPPVFRGGNEALHLSDPSHVELEDLVVAGSSQNGINIDDGGSYETPARWIVLRRIKIRDVGPRGNRDGLKLSGVDDFLVRDCSIERWGIGGSAIDMVGCHRGIIEGCRFHHTDDAMSSGVQAKGGSSGILVKGNRFENAGGRGVNAGGSTGLRFFRPPLEAGSWKKTGFHEAGDIRVEGNTFIGGGAAVAFVGVDGAVVRYNTIYLPRRWILRILQETRAPGFVPCRGGVISENIIAFRRSELRQAVNIGSGTAPETFRFSRNFWYCLDDPGRSRPRLPAEERGGVYGKDPLFRNPGEEDLRLQDGSPAREMGPGAMPR